MASRKKYLRTIYKLTEKGDTDTSTGELAKELEVSDASASETVKKLEENNLICRKPYKGFTLSPMGKEKAQKASNKYRKLVKTFQDLGLENPGKEAENIEDSISMKAVKLIEEEEL